MTIRKTTPADIGQLLELYAYARQQMKQTGNPTQWGDDRPSDAVLREDIRRGQSYILEEKEQLCGAFAFIIGEDPTYQVIRRGQWMNGAPYGTIHRIASNGLVPGIFRACLAYCMSQIPNIRIDTHEDNLIMQHLLKKCGFHRCGIIYVEDGSPRIAYQKADI